MTPSLHTVGLVAFRMAPALLSSANFTFAWVTHILIGAFKSRHMPKDTGMAAMPYWFKHMRDHVLWFIFASYVPNTILGIANAYNRVPGLDAGGGGATSVGYYASWAYLLGAFFSFGHFPLTFRWRMVGLNLTLLDEKKSQATREVAYTEFMRTNWLRSFWASFTAMTCFTVGSILWAAEAIA
ncbi:hypothetical protein GGS20DRAFT_570281 [Poronia punctata]|nr:hypothetical protein GGS20DRAFT_570281 [Poronia punctata]